MTGLSSVRRKRKMIKLKIPNQMSDGDGQYVEYIVKTSALGSVGTRGLKRIVRCNETGNTEETDWDQTGVPNNMDEHTTIDIKPILDTNGHFLPDSEQICQTPPPLQPIEITTFTVKPPSSPNENFTSPLRVSSDIFKSPVKVSNENLTTSVKVSTQESDDPSNLNWLLNFKVSSLFESVPVKESPVSTKQQGQNTAAQTTVPSGMYGK
uniref:Uncharacterized protein n=1 Tax=Cacopsylla melanoneura TaxID=428564 RepID=A0A8D9ADZ4_9HEMI